MQAGNAKGVLRRLVHAAEIADDKAGIELFSANSAGDGTVDAVFAIHPVAVRAFVGMSALAAVRTHIFMMIDAGLSGKGLEQTPKFRGMAAWLALNIEIGVDHFVDERRPAFVPAMKPQVRRGEADEFETREISPGRRTHAFAEFHGNARKTAFEQPGIEFTKGSAENGLRRIEHGNSACISQWTGLYCPAGSPRQTGRQSSRP